MRRTAATDTATTATATTDDDLPAFLEGDHSGSWSANLERDRYADDRELVFEHALLAVERTEPGHHVNLVTHPEDGNRGRTWRTRFTNGSPRRPRRSSTSAGVAGTSIGSRSRGSLHELDAGDLEPCAAV